MPATAKVQTAKPPARSAPRPVVTQSGVVRRERNCSVARTLDIVSDAWAFLIIREAFFGTQTFEAFRSALGIPRATLTNRLKKLTQLAIFRQVATGSSQRKEYRLTKMGFDLYPSFIALMQFGDRWLASGKPAPLTLVHIRCGCDSHPFVACSHCGERVGARDVKYRDGPGAGRHSAKAGRNTRRASDGSRFLLGRPSSVSRALQIIGDKWSFMVVREGFFGNRRYDKILTELEIAPNILTDRLSRLVANGVFNRRQYQSSPDRYEYLLTDMGRDLYGPFIAMLRWGDRWLSKGKPPLLLKHLPCGHDFHAEVVCDRCKEPIVAADMRYKLAYDPKSFGALGPRSVT
ncbi:helix-turn-helix domain-containing protein [Bradyrhizobium sp. LMTR 3]|uniref:winged helix-turn-helix transcriptional regulator n=1 Tax=Bradyrhizobium sp. LMTR 3 TaxID=189873 RepID=UPI0009FC47EA|nr:helix-turn-helix domain-containing protein [Bradyrhizobium sp. LMTR 3]